MRTFQYIILLFHDNPVHLSLEGVLLRGLRGLWDLDTIKVMAKKFKKHFKKRNDQCRKRKIFELKTFHFFLKALLNYLRLVYHLRILLFLILKLILNLFFPFISTFLSMMQFDP